MVHRIDQIRELISLFRRFFADPTEVPEVLQAKILPSVDGIRGISIIVVILAHINAHYGNLILHHLFAAGIVGVYIFFVISGFLITTLLVKEKLKTGKVSLRKFYSRRTLRIFPLAYLYIIVILILSIILGLNIPVLDFGMAALYLVNLGQFYNVHYFLHHFWSLAVEEQFYLLIAPLLRFPLRTVKWVIIILLPFTLLSRGLLSVSPDSIFLKLLFDLTRAIDGLLIGSLCAFAAFNNLVPWKLFRKYAGVLGVFCLLIIFTLKTDVEISYLKPFFNHTVYSVFIGLFILIMIQPNESWLYKLLNTNFLIQIGILSYSLYMWQQLFTVHALMEFFPWNILPLPLIAWLSYRYYEKPFLRLKKKYSVV